MPASAGRMTQPYNRSFPGYGSGINAGRHDDLPKGTLPDERHAPGGGGGLLFRGFFYDLYIGRNRTRREGRRWSVGHDATQPCSVVAKSPAHNAVFGSSDGASTSIRGTRATMIVLLTACTALGSRNRD